MTTYYSPQHLDLKAQNTPGTFPLRCPCSAEERTEQLWSLLCHLEGKGKVCTRAAIGKEPLNPELRRRAEDVFAPPSFWHSLWNRESQACGGPADRLWVPMYLCVHRVCQSPGLSHMHWGFPQQTIDYWGGGGVGRCGSLPMGPGSPWLTMRGGTLRGGQDMRPR